MPSYLSTAFPALDATDGQLLYRSLGSFWTQIFQDKKALQGYTLGMAEELIQSYYNLTEILGKFSVKDVPLHHKEKWKPLTIRKSEFNHSPLTYGADAAVYGVQPSADLQYGGQIFRYGITRRPNTDATYTYTSPEGIQQVGIIANRIIAPSLALIPGVDFILRDGTFHFTQDLFNSEYIPRTPLLGDMGVPVTYVDSLGKTVQDEFIILWLYQAHVASDALHENFGVLFDLRLPSTEASKALIKGLLNLSVEGPSITALNMIFAAMANTPVVIETTELVEQVYTDGDFRFVITDKHVYRVPATQPLAAEVRESAVLTVGTVLTTCVRLVDTVCDPVWWKRELQGNKLGFASHVFAASCKNQLFFANEITLVTYAAGKLNFPVTGRAADVQAFQDYINVPARKTALMAKLQIPVGGSSSYPLNPVDFLFTNFFKNNTLLLKLEFSDQSQLQRFFDLLPTTQPYLPPHVYILTYLEYKLSEDTLLGLNSGLTIPGFDGTFSLDGSDAQGLRPGDPLTDTEYYKDYTNRMFCVSVGPYRSGTALHTTANLDTLMVNNGVTNDSNPGIKCGLLRTEIPASVIPPGEEVGRLPSTREVPSLLLMDF